MFISKICFTHTSYFDRKQYNINHPSVSNVTLNNLERIRMRDKCEYVCAATPIRLPICFINFPQLWQFLFFASIGYTQQRTRFNRLWAVTNFYHKTIVKYRIQSINMLGADFRLSNDWTARWWVWSRRTLMRQ